MGNASNCCLRACCIEEQEVDPGFTGESTVCCCSPKKGILRHWPPIRLCPRVASVEEWIQGSVKHPLFVTASVRREFSITGFPAVYALELHQWKEAAGLQQAGPALQQEDPSVDAAGDKEAAGLQQAEFVLAENLPGINSTEQVIAIYKNWKTPSQAAIGRWKNVLNLQKKQQRS
ncbi:protein FAM153A isoform X5 [Callithrix jacchus]